RLPTPGRPATVKSTFFSSFRSYVLQQVDPTLPSRLSTSLPTTSSTSNQPTNQPSFEAVSSLPKPSFLAI
ncbi:hypothetical protein Pcinc_041822, partial [Petrolisthes cinctipes]